MVVAALGAAAPLLADLPGTAQEARAAGKTMVSKDQDSGNANPRCKGCRMCTIFYSNCLALNNRVCWRENAVTDRPVART